VRIGANLRGKLGVYRKVPERYLTSSILHVAIRILSRASLGEEEEGRPGREVIDAITSPVKTY
jgi:hypothetical protein